jgi:predicted transcriptional regulator
MLSLLALGRDPILRDILGYVISRGPATAYRIARELNLHFVQVYRKTRQMEELGLVKRYCCERRDLIDATERGLLMCYHHGCASRDLILDKLAARYGVEKRYIRDFLDAYLRHAESKNDLPIDEIPVMVFYAVYRRVGSVAPPLVAILAEYVRVPPAPHVTTRE